MAVPPQYSGCTVEAATPAVEATALSTAACTPPAPNCSAPQVRPGSSSDDVTVYTCTCGCCVRPTDSPTTAAAAIMKETNAMTPQRRQGHGPEEESIGGDW